MKLLRASAGHEIRLWQITIPILANLTANESQWVLGYLANTAPQQMAEALVARETEDVRRAQEMILRAREIEASHASR